MTEHVRDILQVLQETEYRINEQLGKDMTFQKNEFMEMPCRLYIYDQLADHSEYLVRIINTDLFMAKHFINDIYKEIGSGIVIFIEFDNTYAWNVLTHGKHFLVMHTMERGEYTERYAMMLYADEYNETSELLRNITNYIGATPSIGYPQQLRKIGFDVLDQFDRETFNPDGFLKFCTVENIRPWNMEMLIRNICQFTRIMVMNHGSK